VAIRRGTDGTRVIKSAIAVLSAIGVVGLRAPAVNAAEFCSYDSASRTISIQLSQSGALSVYVRRAVSDASIEFSSDGAAYSPCGSATVDNTTDVNVAVSGSDANSVTIDLSNGGFADIKWLVALGDGTDTLSVNGGSAADNVVFGTASGSTCPGSTTTGLNLDASEATPDCDVGANGIESFGVAGNDGDDALSAAGDGAILSAMTIALNPFTGGAGDDTLASGAAAEVLNGGDGTDMADYSLATGPVQVPLVSTGSDGAAGDSYSSIEGAIGSAYNDQLTGSNPGQAGLTGNDILKGGAGVDQIKGEQGDDILHGGADADELDAGDGDDTFDEGSSTNGADTFKPGNGNDTIDYSGRADDLVVGLDGNTMSGATEENDRIENTMENAIAGSGSDEIAGNANVNVLEGGGGSDTIDGEAANDTLYGQGSRDYLIGGDGSDGLIGGAGSKDAAAYVDATSGVTVDLNNTASNTGEAAGDTFTDIEHLWGSEQNDTLSGNGEPNSISGGGGNDVINGRGGNDTLLGRGGADTLNGDLGSDRLSPGGGTDEDVLDGGGGYGDWGIYTQSSAGVTVDLRLSGAQNTGGAGIDTLVNVENLKGSSGDDILTGDASANLIYGWLGTDVVSGGAGEDVCIGEEEAADCE